MDSQSTKFIILVLNDGDFKYPLELVTFSELLRKIYGIPKPFINEYSQKHIETKTHNGGGGQKEHEDIDEALRYCNPNDERTFSNVNEDACGSGSEDEDEEDENKIPIANATTEILNLIITFLNMNKRHYVDYYNPNEKIEGNEWEPVAIHKQEEYYKAIGDENRQFFIALDKSGVRDQLLNVANYMGINMLVLATCSWIASQLTGQTTETIQKYLGFESNITEAEMETLTKEELVERNKNYFTPDELAKIQKEFDWIESLNENS
jgi:hypothetical protein